MYIRVDIRRASKRESHCNAESQFSGRLGSTRLSLSLSLSHTLYNTSMCRTIIITTMRYYSYPSLYIYTHKAWIIFWYICMYFTLQSSVRMSCSGTLCMSISRQSQNSKWIFTRNTYVCMCVWEEGRGRGAVDFDAVLMGTI